LTLPTQTKVTDPILVQLPPCLGPIGYTTYGGQVHAVAKGCVVESFGGAEVADDGLPGMDPDPLVNVAEPPRLPFCLLVADD
jgi:hypothetical protein